MKFGLFYEAQLPKSPDSDEWDPDAERRIIDEQLEQCVFAESLGFDYTFNAEHHFLDEYSHCSAPEVILAALAARTTTMRIGHGIIQMPPAHNHPARTAERVSTLDLVSGGRVEFGAGEGQALMELEGFGTPRNLKKQAWEESTRECLRMMTTAPYPGFDGQFFSMPQRNVIPKPMQKPHPPVWMATSRFESAWLAARYGCGVYGLAFDTPQETQIRVDRYWELIREECRPIGSAINPAVVAVQNLSCFPTDEEAVEKGLPGAEYFFMAAARGNPGFAPRGSGPDSRIYQDFLERRRARGSAAPLVESKDEGVRNLQRAGAQGPFMGSPETLRTNIREYEASHLDALIFMVQVGDRTHEDIMASLELFGREVLPEFQDRHHEQQAWREKQLDGVTHDVVCSI